MREVPAEPRDRASVYPPPKRRRRPSLFLPVMTLSEATAALRGSWAYEPVRRLRLLGAGDSYWAFLLNETWVCRIPRTAAAGRSLRREAALLPWLAPQLPLPIPCPHRTGRDAQGRLLFAASPFLPGPSLSPTRYRRLDAATRARCAAQLGRFLARLHAVNPAAAPAGGAGVPVFSLGALATYLWPRALRTLPPRAAGSEQQFLARVLGCRVEQYGPGDGGPANWLHGDLSHGHVLFDPAAGAVSAVLDFGDLRRGEPAWDLVFLYRDYGPAFVADLLPAYAPPDPAALLRRLYWGYQLAVLDALLDAARATPGPGAAARARAAVARLRRRETTQRRALWTACGLAHEL